MTLYEIVGILKQIALTQPNVKSATDGSIYDIMNATNSVKYDVVHLSQTKHITDEETDTYGFNIFYVSRLEDSLEDNRLQIQSVGKEVLDNILRTFCENWNIDYPEIIFYPFTQKFADLCAGCYCRVEIEVPKSIICADDYIAEVIPSDKNIRLQDVSVTITENGTRVITPAAGFDGIGQITITTDVPGVGRLQDKDVEFTNNGEYTVRPDDGFDGLASVAVDVDVPDRYDEGYDDGKEDGVAEQKAKLSTTSVTENGTYTRADGYSAITVDVPQGQGYEEGYEDGEAAQKAKLTVSSFTENNTYTREDGWSAVTINVPDRYNDGYYDGLTDQKAKLITLYAVENGVYSAEDGYSTITVDVPQTGYTQQDLDDAYNRGYQDGLEACRTLPVTATSITLNVADTITDSGTGTTTVNPVDATTNLSYSSNNTDLAVINGTTGEITVKATGSVTFCVRDSISNLQSCKTVNVVKTPPSTDGALMIKYRVTSTTEPTQVVYTPSIASFASYAISNGVSYNVNSKYITFPTTGDIWVYYILKDPSTCPANAFKGLDDYQHQFARIPITVVEARLPDTITYVGANSFYHQPQLSAVTLGQSVERIGRSAFTHCNTLSYLYIPRSYTGNTYMETINGAVSIFGGNTKNINVYYEGNASDWLTRISFKGYASNPLFQGGRLYTNSSSGFTGSPIVNLTIPTDVTTISDFAFDGCGSITAVTIHSGVTRLGYACFRGCPNLTKVTDNRTTPQTLATTWQGAVSGTDDILQFYVPEGGTEYPIYVPAASVNTYKTAANWDTYANRITAKP